MPSLTQLNFYRRFGVRNTQLFIKPPLNLGSKFQLPLKSIYHHVTYDGIALGPSADDPMFAGYTKPIMIHNVDQLAELKGMPRRQSMNMAQMLSDLRAKNRRLKPMSDLELAAKDATSLICYNYCWLPKLYKYIRAVFTDYNKWYNIFATVVDQMANIASRCDNNQYIVAGVPTVLPSVGQLNAASQNLIQQHLTVFHEPNAYLILEIWKWLSEKHHTQSLFAKIPRDKLKNINIIYRELDKWTTLNLGYLDAFRQDPADKTEKADNIDKEAGTKLDPDQVQKRFLVFLMRVMQSRTVTANTTDEQDIAVDETGHLETDVEEPTDLIQELDPISVDQQELVDADILDVEETQETPEERKVRIQSEDADLDKVIAELNDIASRKETGPEISLELSQVFTIPDPEPDEAIKSRCSDLADQGLLTAGEYKRFLTMSETYKSIKAPDGTTLDKYIKVEPKSLEINKGEVFKDSPTVLDKSMLKSTLADFDRVYVGNGLKKHTAAMVMSVQKAGVIVTDYTVEEKEDVLGAYSDITLRLVPIEGAPSTLKMKIPAVNEDGSVTANGVNYKYRKQFFDLPIRKIKPERVALSSYYGKTFVTRGRKKVFDYGYWLQSEVLAKALDKQDNVVQNLMPANVFDNTFKAPRTYSALAMTTKSFESKGYKFHFDHKLMESVVPEQLQKLAVASKSIVVALSMNASGATKYLVMDEFGTLHATTDGVNLEMQGSLEQWLELDIQSAPVEFAEVGIFGQDIPVGILLSYYYGFSNLLKLLKVEPRRFPAGTRNVGGDIDDYSLVFADETLVFSRSDKLASLVIGGFRAFHKAIKGFSVYSFDKRAVYLNVLESQKIGVRYLREMELIDSMFVDPITLMVLKEMKEPENFRGLVLRACEMLLDDEHPDEQDLNYMRIRGSERFAGAVYTELVNSLRVHNGQMGKSNKRIELNPYAVWTRISEDSSKAQMSEINPIQALKEIEAVTYTGEGGRSKQSMVKGTRKFHESHKGVISESTVDSSDVGINVYMPANPKLKSALGLSEKFDFKKDGAASLISTSALLAPGSDRDDAKRVNFVAIQQGHTLACEGYHQPTMRTGYEEVVAQRSYDLFAVTAKKPGKVTSLDDKGIIVTYDDGEVRGYEIGKRFGNAAGLTVPHEIVTMLTVGSKFKEGDAIVYNSGFFEPDVFDPKRIVFKNSFNVNTVLWESTQTLEDASSISPRAAEKLRTQVTKVKTITLGFDEVVAKLIKVGERVNYDSVLCIIQDAVTAAAGGLTDETIDALSVVSSQTPKAGVKGTVDRIEVYYHGDLEDMSDSLRAISIASDKEFKKRAQSRGKKGFTGSVDSGFRIERTPLGLDQVAIRIYITTTAPAGVGDKGVFCNQLKTVFSEIMEGEYTTESGDQIDAIFGYNSIDARIVNSAYILGTTNTILKVLAKKMVQVYNQ